MVWDWLRRRLGLQSLIECVTELGTGIREHVERGERQVAEFGTTISDQLQHLHGLGAHASEGIDRIQEISLSLSMDIQQLRELADRSLAGQREVEVRTAEDMRLLGVELAREIAAGQREQVRRIDGLQEAVAGNLSRLLSRDKAQLAWSKEVAQLLSRLRDEAGGRNEQVISRLSSLEGVLREVVTSVNRSLERERAQMAWTKEVAQLLTGIRDRELVAIRERLEAFDNRLLADRRAQARISADRDLNLHGLTATLAADFERLRSVVLGQSGGSPYELDKPIGGKALPNRGVARSDLDARSFGLRHPSVEPELEGLFALGDWLSEDPHAAALLSRVTRARLRLIHPPGQRQLQTISCRSGLDLQADMGDMFAATASFGWIQEAQDFSLFMSLVEPGAVVIDVGANFGLYAAHAALYAGSEGRVIAFEPAPRTFELLRQNIEANDLGDRSLCLCAAVADRTGIAEFNLAEDSAFSGLRDTGRSARIGCVKTDVVAIDSFQPVNEAGSVDLIKIDVEGGEGDVLAGAVQLFKRSPNLIAMFEFSHKNLDEAGCDRLLGQLERLGAAGFSTLARRTGEGVAPVALASLRGKRSENLFICRPDTPGYQKLRASAAAQEQRTISPFEAAALALLKQQAREAAGPLPAPSPVADPIVPAESDSAR